jgi:hypothetical protein
MSWVPVLGFLRRRDLAEVIEARVTKAAGAGHRRIAGWLGLHPDTVRGWLRRFAARAGEIREHFTPTGPRRWVMATCGSSNPGPHRWPTP